MEQKLNNIDLQRGLMEAVIKHQLEVTKAHQKLEGLIQNPFKDDVLYQDAKSVVHFALDEAIGGNKCYLILVEGDWAVVSEGAFDAAGAPKAISTRGKNGWSISLMCQPEMQVIDSLEISVDISMGKDSSQLIIKNYDKP
jgi:hypothetical protein